MAIDRNTIVDIPDNAYVGKDQSVFIKDKNVYDPQKRYNIVRHTVIGRCISKGKMYPNSNYVKRFPVLYAQASGQKLRRRSINMGFYISTLGIAEKLGLYDVLIKCFGIENANMILDFSMYSMIYHSCVADQYQSSMKDQMIFSNSLWSPLKLSSFFKYEFTEPRISEFKRLWALRCMDRGIKEVWLAIDGSNNDCSISDTELCENGNAKSHMDTHIVSYMYVVDASTGDPIAIFVCRGGRVDIKAVLEVIGWLKAYDMHAKGVIVDREFANEEVFKAFDNNGIAYVAMLKGNTLAHSTMLNDYADKIRMKYEFMLGKYRQGRIYSSICLQNDSPLLYGTSSKEKMRIFSSHEYRAYTHLIYDRQNGGDRQETWYRKVTEKAYSLQRALHSGEKICIPEEFKGCIIEHKIDGNPAIFVNQEAVQRNGDRKGYFTLATSIEMEADEANSIYALRNSSEEIYSMLKSHIGADITGVWNDDSVVAKLTVAFITSILRNEIVKTAKELKIPTNKIIKELDNIKIYLDNEDKYYVCHTENQRELDFLERCGFKSGMLDGIATQSNERASSIEPDPRHKLPEIKEESSRHRGRPKGSKNLQPKKAKGPDNDADSNVQKRHPGRPKGSRNKPKPAVPPVKRKRGRPRKEKI